MHWKFTCEGASLSLFASMKKFENEDGNFELDTGLNWKLRTMIQY